MEPAFHRGDLLFLTNYEHEDIRVGEIVVFKGSNVNFRYSCSHFNTDFNLCAVLRFCSFKKLINVPRRLRAATSRSCTAC